MDYIIEENRVSKEVARQLTDEFDGFLRNSTYLIMDHDKKYSHEFRRQMERDGVTSIRCPPRAPNCNTYAERFVRTIKEEYQKAAAYLLPK